MIAPVAKSTMHESSARSLARLKVNIDALRHGTRARYVHGCRCDECRAANTAAYHAEEAHSKALAAELATAPAAPVPQVWTRPDGTKVERVYKRACPGVEGEPCPTRSHLRSDSGPVCRRCRQRLTWNGLVDAAPAREHLQKLSAAGIGRDAVAAASDVAVAVISEVYRGNRTQIRRNTARAILAVDEGAVADGGLVPAKETRARLRWLLRNGWTKREIARELGCEAEDPKLQIATRKSVRARTALKVEKLHRSFLAALEETKKLDRAGSYTLDERLAILRRAPDCASADLLAEYGHVWANERAVSRDRAELRARQSEIE